MNEAQLVRECQRQNRQAQKILFERFSDRFFRLSVRYVKDEAEAEDLVMMAFVKIFDKVSSFIGDNERAFEAWMRKIVINEALMFLRRKNNFNLTESLDFDSPVADMEALQDVPSDDLYQLVLELPPGYRTVFNLYVIEGYDHLEISTMLSISESTSRSQLFKAKQLLKRKIKQEGMNYGT